MFTDTTRRDCAKYAAGTALLGLDGLGFLAGIPAVSAQNAKLDPNLVRFDSGVEPLVRFLEETPRDRLLEEVADRIKNRLSYRELVTALFLAGVRNILPTGRFNFHCFLMVHATHQASLASPEAIGGCPSFGCWTSSSGPRGPTSVWRRCRPSTRRGYPRPGGRARRPSGRRMI
jgi:hypothetical protein